MITESHGFSGEIDLDCRSALVDLGSTGCQACQAPQLGLSMFVCV